MRVKVDDRFIEEASPDVAKPFVKVMIDEQVLTIYDRDQLEQLDQILDFLIANWKESDAQT